MKFTFKNILMFLSLMFCMSNGFGSLPQIFLSTPKSNYHQTNIDASYSMNSGNNGKIIFN